MIDITLYGKESSVYQYLKMHVKNLADKAGIDIAIKEVNDIKSFIDESIVSIPTVKLGGEYKSIKDKNINSFIKEVNGWILEKAGYGNLKKIYVPIDFSDLSLNALHFAKEMTEYTSDVLCLVHCYYPSPVIVNEVSYIDPEIEKIERATLEKFRKQISSDGEWESPNSIFIDSEFLNGFPVPELVNLSQRDENLMIVIGSSPDKTRKRLFGSVSTDLVLKSACPVMIVPEDIKFKPFRKIVFCSNDVNLDAYAIDELIKVASPYNADIDIIHVDQHDNYQENQLLDLIKNFYPKDKLKYSLIQGKSKVDSILDYVEIQQGDLLVMSRSSRGLIKEFFHKSLAKRLLIKTQIPLLVLHH